MKIILSTTNPSKALQIKAMLDRPDVEVLTLVEAGIAGEAVEDGTTLEENAMKKAVYARQNTSEEAYILADDTGLFITALDGKPGIHAARWAGNVSTDEITQYTLKQLEGKTDRSALFKTVIVLISPDGRTFSFSGEVNGTLAEFPKMKPQPKMPYSGLFSPEGTGKVWAEMTTKEENAISHRGKALRQVVAFLKEQL